MILLPAATALVNPYLHVSPDAVNPIVYGAVGLSDHADLYFGYGATLPHEGDAASSLGLSSIPASLPTTASRQTSRSPSNPRPDWPRLGSGTATTSPPIPVERQG